MDVKKFLLEICEIDCVSGNEEKIADFLEEKLLKYSNNIVKTKNNSVICKINENKNSTKKIMLEAHIDCVGMIVKSITKEGFLEFVNCGAIDPKILVSKEVTVLSKTPLPGIIFKNPEKKIKKGERLEIKHLLIDLNLPIEEIRKKVQIGNNVVFKYNPIFLKNNRISVRFLDDKACVTAIFLVLEKLKKEKIDLEIVVLFSSQEETTQLGAKASTYLEKTSIAIGMDVSFAKTLDCNTAGSVGEMGKGPMIGISPILDRTLTKKLIETAKKKKIPYQLEIMNKETSTDADEIAFTKDGIRTIICSIPIKNMHTQVEIVDLKDIETTAELVYQYILSEKGD